MVHVKKIYVLEKKGMRTLVEYCPSDSLISRTPLFLAVIECSDFKTLF